MTAPVEVRVEEIERPAVAEANSLSTGLSTQRRAELATTGANATGTTIADLLRVAIERDTPVEQLEKLVELHERMEARQAAREFARAFAAFQAEVPSIKRNKEGKVLSTKGNYSFTYADLDETVMTIRPIAAKNGLSFGWDHVVTKDTLTSIFTVRHEAGHSVSNQYMLPVDNPSGMSPQQKVGAAQTFADRRSMNSGLGLTSSDEDAEAIAAVDPTPINDDQAIIINDLIAETAANVQKVLTFADAESIAKIRAIDYERVVAALEERKDAKQRKAAT